MPRGTKQRVALPVCAVDVFRLLAARKVAEDDAFVRTLYEKFDAFMRRVLQTPRLKTKENFLSYSDKHDKKEINKRRSNMSEQELCSAARGFMGVSGNEAIGTVLDYQVPLEEYRGSGEGKVDLISQKGDTIYVIEVKQDDSSDHPLRAMFEALTFWLEMINKDAPERNPKSERKYESTKCLPGNAGEFVEKYNASKDARVKLGDGKGDFENRARLVPAILLSKDSKIYTDLCKKPKHPYSALYKRVLDYVECFYYTAKENSEHMSIAKFDPRKEWKR